MIDGEASSPREERVIGGATDLVVGYGGDGKPSAHSNPRLRFALMLVLLLGTPVAIWVWAPACHGRDKAQIVPRAKTIRYPKRLSRRQRQRLPAHNVEEEEEEDLFPDEEDERPARKARPQRCRLTV